MLSEMMPLTLIRYGLAKYAIFNQYSKGRHISTNNVWQNILLRTIHRIITTCIPDLFSLLRSKSCYGFFLNV